MAIEVLVDYSAYEGTVIAGHVDTVLFPGRVLIDDGQYLGTKSHGHHLRRGLSQYPI
jgi:dihydropyrimidinase